MKEARETACRHSGLEIWLFASPLSVAGFIPLLHPTLRPAAAVTPFSSIDIYIVVFHPHSSGLLPLPSILPIFFFLRSLFFCFLSLSHAKCCQALQGGDEGERPREGERKFPLLVRGSSGLREKQLRNTHTRSAGLARYRDEPG